MGEFDIYGVFVSPLLVFALAAFIIGAVLRNLMSRAGMYRFIWHPALFDLAIFIIVLGAVVALSSHRV